MKKLLCITLLCAQSMSLQGMEGKPVVAHFSNSVKLTQNDQQYFNPELKAGDDILIMGSKHNGFRWGSKKKLSENFRELKNEEKQVLTDFHGKEYSKLNPNDFWTVYRTEKVKVEINGVTPENTPEGLLAYAEKPTRWALSSKLRLEENVAIGYGTDGRVSHYIMDSFGNQEKWTSAAKLPARYSLHVYNTRVELTPERIYLAKKLLSGGCLCLVLLAGSLSLWKYSGQAAQLLKSLQLT
jgi:hypothetical protein